MVRCVLSFLLILVLAGCNWTAKEEEDPEKRMAKLAAIENEFPNKEIQVSYHNGLTESELLEALHPSDTTIRQEDGRYILAFPKNTPIIQLLDTLDALNERPDIKQAELKESTLHFPGEAEVFARAIEIYDGEVTPYYSSSPDSSFAFLYPSDWKVLSKHAVGSLNRGKRVTFSSEYLKEEWLDEKIDHYLYKASYKEGRFNGVFDRYERNGVTIVRYELEGGRNTAYKGLVYGSNRLYVIEPTTSVSIDELSLILDSFLFSK